MKLKDLQPNKRYFISSTHDQLIKIGDDCPSYFIIKPDNQLLPTTELDLTDLNFQEERPLVDNFLDDNQFLDYIANIRYKYQNHRNIVETGLPKLKELAAVVPEIFDPFTPAGERNRRFILNALAKEDYNAISLFIQNTKPLYLSRKG